MSNDGAGGLPWAPSPPLDLTDARMAHLLVFLTESLPSSLLSFPSTVPLQPLGRATTPPLRKKKEKKHLGPLFFRHPSTPS